LVANIQDRLVPTMDDGVIGFAERYTTDWTVRSSSGDERRTIMGHVLKTAWVLGRYAEITDETSVRDTAEQLADHVLENGYDHTYGGPYKDYNRFTGEMLLYGLQDSTKAWWQMEQAVTAGLELYRQTGEGRWLEMADETMDFFMAHFQDATHGEVYADVTRDGRTIPQWGNLFKGDAYKAAYHSAELAYLAYLYAALYVHNAPATVYYRFEASPEVRTVVLNPIDAGPDGLRLSSALLGGQSLAVDATARTVTLPANASGVVSATFVNPAPVSTEPTQPLASLALGVPAPNPARGVVRFRATLAAPAWVSLTVHDALGREVATVVRDDWSAGDHSVRFDASALAPGVYIVHLIASGERVTTQLTVVR
ncbi:MAG: AGE family epimerase/isomerase, partial [Bacteroidota bacterium]